jgi:hypothetical protein
MKNKWKLFAIMFSIVTLITVSACNNSSILEEETHKHAANTDAHDEHGHEHIFACPMHPEVRGHEGESCSKCGMPLEHMDELAPAGNYTMQFSSTPQKMKAGKEVLLFFTPKNKDKQTEAVPLDVEHEKKIHLIIVSEDLSWFDHVHPEYRTDGSYTVKQIFPDGGNYLLYADYKPTSSTHQLEKISVQVEGKAAAAMQYSKKKEMAKSGDFSVTLVPDAGKFISNTPIHFDGSFLWNGKSFDVNNLQNYLGAKGHMVAINMLTKEYMHLHPEVEGSILHFHTTFETVGMYRVWLQFMYDGKLHTTDFVLEVEQGMAQKHDHFEHDDHDHAH